MEYTKEELAFMSGFHPDIEIEDIEFRYLIASGEEGLPVDFTCFMSEEAREAYWGDGYIDGFRVTFVFRDRGTKMSQKYVKFDGLLEIDDDRSEDESVRCKVPVCITHPDITFSPVADRDGRFYVSVPVLLRQSPDDDDYDRLYKDLIEHSARIRFNNIRIANQFVTENIISISGRFHDTGKKEQCFIEKDGYDLSEIISDDSDDE